MSPLLSTPSFRAFLPYLASSGRSSSAGGRKKLTPFNKFMQTETARLKEEKPELDNKERCVRARSTWPRSRARRLTRASTQVQDGHRELEQAKGKGGSVSVTSCVMPPRLAFLCIFSFFSSENTETETTHGSHPSAFLPVIEQSSISLSVLLLSGPLVYIYYGFSHAYAAVIYANSMGCHGSPSRKTSCQFVRCDVASNMYRRVRTSTGRT